MTPGCTSAGQSVGKRRGRNTKGTFGIFIVRKMTGDANRQVAKSGRRTGSSWAKMAYKFQKRSSKSVEYGFSFAVVVENIRSYSSYKRCDLRWAHLTPCRAHSAVYPLPPSHFRRPDVQIQSSLNASQPSNQISLLKPMAIRRSSVFLAWVWAAQCLSSVPRLRSCFSSSYHDFAIPLVFPCCGSLAVVFSVD